MRERIIVMLKELTEINGIPGHEEKVVNYVVEKAEKYTDKVEVDTFGNVIATIKGKPGSKSIMLDAHTDEVGLLVTKIEDNGFLRFVFNGNPSIGTITGKKVFVGEYIGVIGARNFHTTPAEEMSKVPEINEMFIDIGASSYEEVIEMGIRLGTPITFKGEFEQLGCGDIYAGKAIDDRVGCLINLLILEEISKLDELLEVDVHCTFTVQEEIGLKGAEMTAYNVNPDFAIALDNVLAEDTPDQPMTSRTSAFVGKGPVINFMEFEQSSIRGALYPKKMVDHFIKIANEENIDYQMSMLTSMTNVASIHLERGGIPSIYIGPATRYAHSQVETVSLTDIIDTYKLIYAFIKSINKETNFNLI